jgi:hypothetical protein
VTDQEKKLQRAQLQVELDDSLSDLAHLQEKAVRLAEQVQQVARKLAENARLQPAKSDFTMEADLVNRLSPEHQACLDFTQIIRLIEDLKVARQKVFNLQERKTHLANASGWTIAS